VDARLAAQGLSALADDGRAALGDGASSAHRLSEHDLLFRPQAQAKKHGRGRSGTAENLRKARRSDARAAILACEQPTVAVDAVFDSVSVATTFKKTLAEKGIIFCSFSEAVQSIPNW
jgi:Fe-S cluster assembly scaffold protein SufB